MHGQVANLRDQRQPIEVGHLQVGEQQVAWRFLQNLERRFAIGDRDDLRSISPSCSATQRRTAALSSACKTVLLMSFVMPHAGMVSRDSPPSLRRET